MTRSMKRSAAPSRKRAALRPRLEVLDDRSLPAIIWVAPGGGEWTEPGNWLDPVTLQHRVPSFSQGDVVGLPGDQSYTVSNHASCVSLSVGSMSTFTVFGFAGLNVAESAGFSGSLTLSNGAIYVGTDFGVNDELTMIGNSHLNLSATGTSAVDDFNWLGGSVSGGSETKPVGLFGPTHITGITGKTLTAFLVNHDTVTQTTTLETNGGRMTNATDGTYVLVGDSDFQVQNLTHFVNEGMLHKTADPGTSTVGGFQSTPTGHVVVDGGRLELQMTFNAVSEDLDVAVASGAEVSFTTGANNSGTAGRFHGTLTASGGGKVFLEGPLLIGQGGATFDVPAGILEWTGGDIYATEGTLTNVGTMTLTGALSKRLEGAMINNGVVGHSDTGVLNIAGNTPGSTLENNGTYELFSDAGIADAGTFVNAGTLLKSGGTGSSVVTPFHFQNLGGWIEVDTGNIRLPYVDAVMSGGHFQVSPLASLDLPGGTYTGLFTGAGGGLVRLSQGSTLRAGAGGAEFDLLKGMFRATFGTLDGATDGFTIAADSDLTADQSGAVVFEGLVHNKGTIKHAPGLGGVVQLNGTLDNQGTYILLPGTDITYGGNSGLFNNSGIFLKTGNVPSTVRVDFTNAAGGHFNVLADTLTFYRPLTNAGGEVTVSAGAMLDLVVGAYTQTGGTTALDDSTLRAPVVDILGGTFGGTGTVAAFGGVTNGGVMSPGPDPVGLTIDGDFTQITGGSLAIDLNGMNSGRLAVNGAVHLDGSLSVSGPSNRGDVFFVLENDLTDAVTGGFFGLGEGTILPGAPYQLSYLGGTGNDVTITDVRPAPGPVLLAPDPLSPGQFMLVVNGTPGDDNIRLAAGPRPGDVRVRLNGVFHGPFRPTTRLVVHGNDGNDRVWVNRQLRLPAWLYGDDGNDALVGGRGPNVIEGGDGDDALTGRDALDILVGGTGADVLKGGNGSDLLIAGFTAYDGDEAALAAIQAEWLSGHIYDDRAANLRNIANPSYADRRNGSVFLLAGGPSPTVSDDGAHDVLVGGGGLDAFFANLDPTGMDAVRLPNRREQRIDIN